MAMNQNNESGISQQPALNAQQDEIKQKTIEGATDKGES